MPGFAYPAPLAPRALVSLLLLTLACACAKPSPPAAPRGPSATRFELGGEVRFRVLTEAGVALEAPPRVAVAETRAELEDRWDELALSVPLPRVDFDAELVLFFTEDSFCNDGTVRGVVLTVSGDVVPELARSWLVCPLIGYPCRSSRVYALALPRGYFGAGGYRLRHGLTPAPFELRAPARASAPKARSQAKRLPLPSAPEPPGPRHPRRAQVRFGGGDLEHGVWVRDDAAWLPRSRERDEVRWPRASEGVGELFAPEVVCDSVACAPVIARGLCKTPECPAGGELLFTDAPLASRGAWPREPDAWERLMLELSRDPALNAAIGAPEFPRPKSVPVPGWAANRYRSFVLETALLGEAGVLLDRPGSLAGAGLRLGLRFNRGVSDTTTTGYVLEPLVGDSLGADLRFHALHQLDAPTARYAAGIALSADNIVGRSTSEGRFRLASLLALLVPEVGLMHSSAGTHPYTSNSLPLSALVTEQLAVDFRPSFTLRFAPARAGGTEAQASLSLGLTWRFPRSPCP